MSNDAIKILAIVAAIIAAVLISDFAFEFYQWNRTQSCATAGGRNCRLYSR